MEDFTNRVANFFISQGFKAGDEVALFMDSRPEFVGFWLGLAKAGVIAALINTNQRGQTLIHSITTVKCKALIFGSELESAVRQVVLDLNGQSNKIKFYRWGNKGDKEAPDNGNSIPQVKDLKTLIEATSSDPSLIKHEPAFADRLFYIYTSGTTGLPKAAIIKHCRYIWIGSAVRNLSGLSGPNIIYTCIPLYHLSGGVLGTNQCLIWGDSMVIRSRFSASKFWEDCIKYNCNMAQYIGEICRYLMAQPHKPTDTQHKVTFIFGNGLRPEIWGQFVRRFNIKRVGEFYGSTEGNANIINNTNKDGACGFISQILPRVYPVALIKVNDQTYEPVRGPDGLCIRAGPGESGEFVGKIIVNDASRAFDGYVDPEATQKKIIRDVYKKGDAAFLSGDILRMDEYGYVYFKDRTGDTFRWKGENVSTMEVEAIISNILKLRDCVVYGVSVPECEGRAGMVAIPDPDKGIRLNDFLHEMKKRLPHYSIPVFVRIVDRLEATGTYKLPKTFLQSDGFNPSRLSDPLFVLDSKKEEYRRMDVDLYQDIITGKFRV